MAPDRSAESDIVYSLNDLITLVPDTTPDERVREEAGAILDRIWPSPTTTNTFLDALRSELETKLKNRLLAHFTNIQENAEVELDQAKNNLLRDVNLGFLAAWSPSVEDLANGYGVVWIERQPWIYGPLKYRVKRVTDEGGVRRVVPARLQVPIKATLVTRPIFQGINRWETDPGCLRVMDFEEAGFNPHVRLDGTGQLCHGTSELRDLFGKGITPVEALKDLAFKVEGVLESLKPGAGWHQTMQPALQEIWNGRKRFRMDDSTVINILAEPRREECPECGQEACMCCGECSHYECSLENCDCEECHSCWSDNADVCLVERTACLRCLVVLYGVSYANARRRVQRRERGERERGE